MSVVVNGIETIVSTMHCSSSAAARSTNDWIDIVLSEFNYVPLQEAAKELLGLIRRRDGFPRFEYNSLLSRATITTDPSDLNTLVRDHLSLLIHSATVSKLEEHGFSSKILSGVQCDIDDEAASTRRYKGSRKIVDNGMQFRKGHCSYVWTCAIIGGPMQQYSTIQDDVRLLLYGTRYQAVILVGIEENPEYHSPIVDEAVECIRPYYGQEVQLARKGFRQAVEETPLGPYMYEKFAGLVRFPTFFLKCTRDTEEAIEQK